MLCTIQSQLYTGIVSIDSALYPHYINSEFIVGSNYNYVADEQKFCQILHSAHVIESDVSELYCSQ